MDPGTIAVFYGLASALTWGAADFSGGLATKRANVYNVVLISQIVGGLFLAILALLFREAIPPAHDLIFGALAGLAGAVGLLGLYSGLASGRMSMVAPLTAVTAATVPIFFSMLTEGFPPLANIAGFGLALAAVWLLSNAGGSAVVERSELGYALLAGAGFGLYFILIDQANEVTVFWPLTSARLASVSFIALYIKLRGHWQRLPRPQLPLIFLAGLLDALGNAFFALAARYGRLDLAAVLSSLYPASTVLLAQVILHERLNRTQWVGVLIGLLAIVLISL